MITFTQIDEIMATTDMIDRWMAEDRSMVHRKARNRESFHRAITYLSPALLVAIVWLMPLEWLHWICRVVFTVIMLSLALFIRCMDTATEIPDDIPMNREEEILWEELEGRKN